jgi:hypothetical protein
VKDDELWWKLDGPAIVRGLVVSRKIVDDCALHCCEFRDSLKTWIQPFCFAAIGECWKGRYYEKVTAGRGSGADNELEQQKGGTNKLRLQ